MAESTYHPKHVNQVIELARNELAAMLTRQTAIDKKVRQLKRTLKALGELATTKPADHTTEISIANNHNGEYSSKISRQGKLEKVPPDAVEAGENPRLGKKSIHPKLQRACRIALLESEEAATAAEVYDRIVRRGSYRLIRYKRPLLHVINALDALALSGEVTAVAGENFRNWIWNPRTDLNCEDSKSGAQSTQGSKSNKRAAHFADAHNRDEEGRTYQSTIADHTSGNFEPSSAAVPG